MPDPLHPRRLRRPRSPSCATSGCRPTSSTWTWGCPRCRSTPGRAASPTPTTRRSTCGWIPEQELTAAGDRQHLGRAPAGAPAARVRRGALRVADRPRDRPRAAPRASSTRPSSWSTRSRPPSRCRRSSPAAIPPSAPSRRCGSRSTTSWRSSTQALPLAWDAAGARRAAGGDLLPLARGPARQALPRRRARAAASARRSCRSASAAASPRPSC